MRSHLVYVALLSLLVAPMSFGEIEETIVFDNAIAVYWSTDPSTYFQPETTPASIPIPVSDDGVCVVDTTVIDAMYADFIYGPSVITVRTEDHNEGFDREPFALGRCMADLVDVLASKYPEAEVLIDVTQLFWTDSHRNTLYANYQEAASVFWQMVQASGAVLTANEIYGLLVNDEAYNATNASLNSAVQFGVDQWSSWSTVDRWVGFSLTDHVPGNRAYEKTVNGGTRATNGFPWRYDVVSFHDYGVFNPRVPSDPYNAVPLSGQDFAQRYATFLSRLRPGQRPHLNVRAYWDDVTDNSGWTTGGTGWSIDYLRWLTRAWCRWAKDHPEVRSWSFWSYDQHLTRLGLPPVGVPDSPSTANDDADDIGYLYQASTLYDPNSSYYVPELRRFHDTVLRHGGSTFQACP